VGVVKSRQFRYPSHRFFWNWLIWVLPFGSVFRNSGKFVHFAVEILVYCCYFFIHLSFCCCSFNGSHGCCWLMFVFSAYDEFINGEYIQLG